jgi:hypothetical protein
MVFSCPNTGVTAAASSSAKKIFLIGIVSLIGLSSAFADIVI